METPRTFQYEIGGRVFRQQKLVLGQVEHLGYVLDALEITLGDVGRILKALGGRLPQALGCVLIPDGMDRDKLVKALDEAREREQPAEHVAFLRVHLEWDQAGRIVTDFFVCNPVTTIPELMARINGIVVDGIELMREATTSLVMPKRSTPTSPPATSPSETPSVDA